MYNELIQHLFLVSYLLQQQQIAAVQKKVHFSLYKMEKIRCENC